MCVKMKDPQVSPIPEWFDVLLMYACGSLGSLALFLFAAGVIFVSILNNKLSARVRIIGLAAFFSPYFFAALGSGASRSQGIEFIIWLCVCLVIPVAIAMGISMYSVFKVGLPFAEKTFALMFVGLWLSLFLLRLFASIYYGYQPHWD